MMAKDMIVRDKDKEKDNENGNRHDALTGTILKYMYDPTRQQLMGLTNIPLSQVNPLAWMIVFDAATEQLAQYLEWRERKDIVMRKVREDKMDQVMGEGERSLKSILDKAKELSELSASIEEEIKVEERKYQPAKDSVEKPKRWKWLERLKSRSKTGVAKPARAEEARYTSEIDKRRRDLVENRIKEELLFKEAKPLWQKALEKVNNTCKKAAEDYIKQEPIPELNPLSELWSDSYAWLRRSIDGAFIMTSASLASKEMETQEMEPEGVEKYNL